MFAKIFALFALLVVVAFAAPNPKPQFLTYASGLDYAYPAAGVVPSVYSPYSGAVAYSAVPAVAGQVYL